MQVILSSDSHTSSSPEMAAHLETVIQDALGRFGDQVTRVEAHLADPNAHAKAHPDEIQCTLEARLKRFDPVVAKDRAGTAHQAISGAVAKLRRAVETTIEKHDPRRGGPRPGDPAFDAAIDSAG